MTRKRCGRVANLCLTIAAFVAAFSVIPATAQEGGPSGPKPKVLMLPTQGVQDAITSIVPERIGELSRKGVREEGRITLMPTYEEIQTQLNAQGQSSAAVAQAQELYVSGIGLLTAGEDKKAVETFQRAVDIMEQNLVDLTDFGLLADTLVNLALAYHNAEFDLDARKAMKAYAHVKQDKVLDPEKYPKELIEIYRDEVKKIVKGGPGRLTISSSVEGAAVSIDGVEKGMTPLEITDVGFGEHYLVVKHPSAGTWTEKIRVRGRKKKQTFDAKLAGAGAAPAEATAEKSGGYYTDLLGILATGRFAVTDIQPYFEELTTQTGAEYVTWILMFKAGSGYVAAPFVFRTSDQRFVQLEQTTFNIELSNLRAGVSAISTSIVEGVLNMPESAVFESVELVEARDPVVVANPTPDASTSGTTSGATDGSAASAYASGTPIQSPPDALPSQGTSTWTYVAYGGAVLAAGALIAGGIILFADGGGSTAPGFNTEVSW